MGRKQISTYKLNKIKKLLSESYTSKEIATELKISSATVNNYRAYLLGYSKVSFIRSGHSRLLEFEKEDSTGRLIDTFSKCPEHVI